MEAKAESAAVIECVLLLIECVLLLIPFRAKAESAAVGFDRMKEKGGLGESAFSVPL